VEEYIIIKRKKLSSVGKKDKKEEAEPVVAPQPSKKKRTPVFFKSEEQAKKEQQQQRGPRKPRGPRPPVAEGDAAAEVDQPAGEAGADAVHNDEQKPYPSATPSLTMPMVPTPLRAALRARPRPTTTLREANVRNTPHVLPASTNPQKPPSSTLSSKWPTWMTSSTLLPSMATKARPLRHPSAWMPKLTHLMELCW